MLNNCTINADGSQPFGVNSGAGSTTCYLEINNCLLIGNGGYKAASGDVINFTGADNICASGVETAIPLAQQVLSQAWTFSTDPLAASTGSQAIYDATTGALINAPGNDAVGVCGVTGIPTTDINGADRIRDTHADPGAFVAPLRTITKSIDAAGGGDYTTFTAAEAAAGTLPTDSDMVQRNEAIVFEAEAGTYDESISINSSSPGPALTMDATRNITYKAAAGSEHDGTASTGVRCVFNSAGSGAFSVVDDFVTIDGLVCTTDTGAVGNRGLIQDTASGTTVRNCVLDVQHSTPWAILNNGGGQTANCVYENNVLKVVSSQAALAIYTIGAITAGVDLTNNTLWRDPAGGANRALFYQTLTGGLLTVTATNNFIFGVSNWSIGNTSGGGALTTAGSGNFIDVVGSNMGVGVALMEGTTTTDDQAASTGSQVIYDATTGAMLNVPGNDAVGVGTSTGAPSTDILGKDRLREGSYGAFYADPGAFTTDRVDLGGTVGVGKDYATYTAAEAATGGYTSLPKSNVRYVFTATPGETISESGILGIYNAGETGPNHNVRFQCLDKTNRAKRLQPTTSDALRINEGFFEWDGIDIEAGNRVILFQTVSGVDTVGTRFSYCTLDTPAVSVELNKTQLAENQGSAAHPHTFENVLTTGTRLLSSFVATAAHTGGTYYVFRNCTRLNDTSSNTFVAVPSATTTGMPFSTIEVYNCLDLAPGAEINAEDYLGSGNVGCAGEANSSSFTSYGIGVNYTRTTDPLAASTGSQVIYDATTGAMLNVPGNDAVGVGTSTGAPSTDILGKDRLRGAYADPGAFTTDLVTITKSIDAAGGGDYTTFTAAEAAVETLPTDTDMVQRNEAIVFECVAGTYDGLIFSWTLTTDATRNVTFKPATGSEHGGVFGAGVILQDNTAVASYILLMDGASTNHCVFDGIALNVRSGVNARCSATRSGVGHIWRNCLFSSEGTQALNISEDPFSCGSASDPIVYENCVTKGSSAYAFSSNKTGSSMRFVNCTHLTSEQMFSFYTYASSSQTAEIVNCVNLGSGASFQDAGPTTTTITGSNNFGGATSPFPVALQAGSQTWTFTTDDQAASTGSQVIYDASNGALVDAPGNDAWQILTDLSVAPATDIEGVTREATGYNPGAFERTAADVGTPLDGGVDYLRDLNIRDRFLRGAAIREPYLRNLRG